MKRAMTEPPSSTRVRRRDRGVHRRLAEHRSGVNRALEDVLELELPPDPAGVEEPLRHAALGPGKRIRPLLLLASHRAAGGRISRDLYRLACSVELVHAYSLVHDDLPCMDDDVLRRGDPTLHVRFGPPGAVMTGAVLMPLAISVTVTAARDMGLPEDGTRQLVRVLTRAGGGAGMVGGQLLDLQAEGTRLTRREVERIHAGKTAALLSASTVMGGVAAGAGPDLLGRLERFGRRLGLAFQVVDDVLDLTGSDRELGKQSGRDQALEKATYPGLFGLEAAEERSRELVEGALGELEGVPRTDELRAIADFVIRRRR